MAPSTVRRSPAIYESQNGQASTSPSTFISQTEIPSISDLTQLVAALRDRRTLITRRRRNLKSDESNVLEANSNSTIDGDVALSAVLDRLEEHVQTSLASVSPTTTKLSLAPPLSSKGRSSQAASPSPRAAQPSASPAPSNVGQGGLVRTKIKIKRDPDRERERSESVIETGSTPAAGVNITGGGASSRRQSPTFEADWDDEGPTRPSRTYQHKRKRQRNSQTRDQDDFSQSEIGSPAPGSSQKTSPHRESPWDTKPLGSGLHSNASGSTQPTIKLKLNPTTHTVPVRNDVLNSSIRRPSTLRGREDFATVPMTPMQASQAAMWELPKRTPETFVPKKPTSKPIRSYPTRPDEVDVDFAKMDWRERDKERDRLEAAAAAAAASVNGPGPGHAVIKEGTAASRARDRKQDQVAHHTFQQWTDAWFRTLTEEDLAWFSSKSDELDAFQFPSLGRHYSEVWEEEEANGVLIPTTYLSTGPALGTSTSTTIAPGLTAVTGSSTRQSISEAASNANGKTMSTARPTASTLNGETPKFDPRNLKDDHLYGGSSEDVHSGPFTERLLAALLPLPPVSASGATDTNTNGVDTNGTLSNSVQMNGHHQSSSASGHSTGRSQDMAEFEERLRRELKAIDVIGNEEIDWSDRADDEISSTLRTVQRLLRKQIRINGLRKTRLFQIALDRMAYQDYMGCLNSVEREIESGWMKRQSQIKKSMQAQKKKKGNNNSSSSAPNSSSAVNGIIAAVAASDGQNVGSPATPGGAPGSTGMAPSSSSIGNPLTDRGGGPMPPQFSDSLLSAMEKRKRLRFAFEPLFADKPLANYTPKGEESIYRDFDFS